MDSSIEAFLRIKDLADIWIQSTSEPGDRIAAMEIQSGQSSANPYNPLSCHTTPPTISNTHCTYHAYLTMNSLVDMEKHIHHLIYWELGRDAEGHRAKWKSTKALAATRAMCLADPTFRPLNGDQRDEFIPWRSIVQQQKSTNTPPYHCKQMPRKQDRHQWHK